MNPLFFWLILLLVFLAAYLMGTRSAAARSRGVSPDVPPDCPPEVITGLEARLSPWLEVTGRKNVGNTIEFEGRLRGKADAMFRRIREALAEEPVTPLLLEGEEDDVRVVVVPQPGRLLAPERPRWVLHWLLFLVTLATTTWAGALHAGVNLLLQPERLVVGLPYSLSLMLILGAHELGHYFTARAHGIRVTPPFFIPVPFALGTFGAFIRIKSIAPGRRALFDVAVAGPLAGLLFAIPALLIGLQYSLVVPANAPASAQQAGVNLSSSVLLAFLAKISLGASAWEGRHLLLHPLAFAGWLGLLVTALNLLPIGQLDGGHIGHALFGSRAARTISRVALALLFLLAVFARPGLMLWAFIVFFIAGTRDVPAADDLTPVSRPRQALGYLSFLLLLLIIVPVPHSFYQAVTFRTPFRRSWRSLELRAASKCPHLSDHQLIFAAMLPNQKGQVAVPHQIEVRLEQPLNAIAGQPFPGRGVFFQPSERRGDQQLATGGQQPGELVEKLPRARQAVNQVNG